MNLQQRRLSLQNKSVFISCVVPVFNEEAVITKFVTELQEELHNLANHFEIIIVDDGSRDHTIDKIQQLPKDYRVKLLGLSRNFGKEIALTAGIEHASGDVVILVDADFQHPLTLINQFLQQWAEGYDMVYG